MSIDFRRQFVGFPARTGGPLTQDIVFVFSQRVISASAAIGSFNIGYDDDDHHLFGLEIEAKVKNIQQGTVVVTVSFFLRDGSTHPDDPIAGSGWIVLIANLMD